MKSLALVLASLAVLVLPPVLSAPSSACDDQKVSIGHTSCCDWPARWAPRHSAAEQRFAIDTESGKATLLLTDKVAAIQLSDRTLHRLERKFKAEQEDDEDNVIAQAIKTAVLGSVRALLDHSAECPIRELRDVEYRNGKLIFISEDGDRVFEDIDVSDEDVMTTFSDRDARAFVREFRKLKQRTS